MTTPPPPAGADGNPPRLSPLWRDDPPKVGDYWLDARLTAAPSGVAYVAHDDQSTSVMLILLSQGAAADPAARDRLAGVVNKLHIDTVIARGGRGQAEGRLGHRSQDEADDPVSPGDAPLAPWVALAYDGTPAALAEADRVLAEVELSRLPLQGTPQGPEYRLHWIEQTAPGVSRLWPLPWPGRHDRAGWLSILASWLLMMLLAALAVLIAILIFQQAPQTSPPPPVPPTGSPPPSSGSPPPSGSPSPDSASPSSGSASPSPGSPSPSSGSPSPDQPSESPSGSGSPSASPSQSPSGEPSPGEESPSGSVGSPTPNSRL
ncbi:MAG: hypothetical protein LCH76_06940 [Actinobacteria bacterium]|nr:hypothetical protein [Actinomycetota bacterium]